MLLDLALEYAAKNRDRNLEELKTFLRIPSVSVSEEHRADLNRASTWLVNALRRLRMENVSVTPDSLFVYGEWLHAVDRPTVLFYGHYDVQTPGPLENWDSPPFEPTLREDCIYARGAADMKGSLWAFLQAVQAITKVGALPVNIKVLLEGEQEIGSPGADEYIAANVERLRSDIVISLDGGVHSSGSPSIVISSRGCAYYEIEVTGPRNDLHSGDFGGVVENPVHVLCTLIAGLHDKNGRITLPGFYDSVKDPVNSNASTLPPSDHGEQKWISAAKVRQLWGEPNYSPEVRVTMRPSLDISGIIGGFTGQGLKNIIPNKATAKIGIRLVPHQDPISIREQLDIYLRTHSPQTVSCSLHTLAEIPCAAADEDSPYLDALCRALAESFTVLPEPRRIGSTEPFTGKLQKNTGAAPVAIGFRLWDSAIHAPNEHQHLPTLFNGIDALIRFLMYVGDTGISHR